MKGKKVKSIKKKVKKSTKSNKKLIKQTSNDQTSQSHLEVHQVLKDVEQLPCSLKQICDLSQQKKETIKASHPCLAAYYYLKPRERAKLFHQINQKYRKKMKPLEPPGSAPKKKTIKFKKRFQIKQFDKSESCEKIKQKRIYSQRQKRNVHFT